MAKKKRASGLAKSERQKAVPNRSKGAMKPSKGQERAASDSTRTRVTATQLEVIIHQNWAATGRTDEILIQAVDGGGTKYKYEYDPENPDLPLAKELLESIAATSGQLPWTFLASGWKIIG